MISYFLFLHYYFLISSERLLKYVDRLAAVGVKCTTIGLGGTPVCKNPGPNMKKLTELYSGSYIFNGKWSEISSCQSYIWSFEMGYIKLEDFIVFFFLNEK